MQFFKRQQDIGRYVCNLSFQYDSQNIFFNLIFFLINQKDFEAILADVHRRAEVLRAEVHHMKRLKEQLLNEKTRCLSQIKDVAQGNRLNFLKFYQRSKVGKKIP